jgi:transcription antitermination factor NusG
VQAGTACLTSGFNLPPPPAPAIFSAMPEAMQLSAPGSESPELRWFVAHTRPRCEKKLRDRCERDGIAATLPCYHSAHKYRGKVVVFQRPLFPGYVFLRFDPARKLFVSQNEHIASLLVVHDQETLERQLREILAALDAGLEVRVAPSIGAGMRVRIKAGPLRGVEGWVEERHGPDTILLRLDFISQAAAVRIGAELVELA